MADRQPEPLDARRDLVPSGFLRGASWYLAAWCRTRKGMRGLRIAAIETLDELAPPREVELGRKLDRPDTKALGVRPRAPTARCRASVEGTDLCAAMPLTSPSAGSAGGTSSQSWPTIS
ncbi:WYL domain-containing protein [Amycolatopsis ultiminotia]|uniref:WYL domain-containing protein n=1 Tax=Amycolatopsis ultiminotia TaxID=543629 RepID=UPI003CD05B44